MQNNNITWPIYQFTTKRLTRISLRVRLLAYEPQLMALLLRHNFFENGLKMAKLHFDLTTSFEVAPVKKSRMGFFACLWPMFCWFEEGGIDTRVQNIPQLGSWNLTKDVGQAELLILGYTEIFGLQIFSAEGRVWTGGARFGDPCQEVPWCHGSGIFTV